ncbi:MAG: serine hydrolase [Planctomycetes bacterium]|nr:serine hydrolase [Planctomycetota bacterium]
MHAASWSWFAVAIAMAPPAPAQSQAPDRATAQLAAAYAAKVMASALFVSGRTQASVLAEELAPDRPLEALVRPLLRFTVDATGRTVTCRIGAATATAVATVDLGCTLLADGMDAERLRRRAAAPPAGVPPDAATLDWPRGDRLPATPPEGVDAGALQAALEAAFTEPEGRPPVRTRAVVVVHGGRLVAERYGPGYDARMRLPGWSMSKTLVGALVGARVQQGQIDLERAPDVPEWQEADDGRRRIRFGDLLAMTAGLAWNESYDDPRSDVLRMLFASADHGAEYARQPPVAPPGERFAYTSGGTNLICRLLRQTFADDRDYWAFPRTALFEPLGMHHTLLETDPSGTLVGSSYGFATARDWARFGLFLADGGHAAGAQILPEGWWQRMTAPAPGSDGRFGWHLWLNVAPDGDRARPRPWPDLPPDLVHLDGHEGQYCVVVPSRRFVLVRLGCTKAGGFDLRGLVRAALAACAD